MTNFEVRFEVRRRQRYAKARQAFWFMIAKTSQISSCALSTTAIASILAGNPLIAKWLLAFAAVYSFIALVFDADGNARSFNMEYHELAQLERTLPDATEAQDMDADKAIRDELYRISVVGGSEIYFECLDALCDNQACISLGIPPRLRLNWMERFVGCNLFPLHYAEKPIPGVTASVKAKPEGATVEAQAADAEAAK